MRIVLLTETYANDLLDSFAKIPTVCKYQYPYDEFERNYHFFETEAVHHADLFLIKDVPEEKVEELQQRIQSIDGVTFPEPVVIMSVVANPSASVSGVNFGSEIRWKQRAEFMKMAENIEPNQIDLSTLFESKTELLPSGKVTTSPALERSFSAEGCDYIAVLLPGVYKDFKIRDDKDSFSLICYNSHYKSSTVLWLSSLQVKRYEIVGRVSTILFETADNAQPASLHDILTKLLTMKSINDNSIILKIVP